jgi:hypothetical protein
MAREEKIERAVYYGMHAGKWTLRSNENDPKAVKRTFEDKNKVQRTVYERSYEMLSGYLVNIQHVDGEFGKQWLFHFKDDEGPFVIALPSASRAAFAILFRLGNLDFTKQIKLKCAEFSDIGNNGKPFTYSTAIVCQDGNKNVNEKGTVLRFFTPESPEIPSWKKIKVNGVEMLDKTEQIEFFENYIKLKILPTLFDIELHGKRDFVEPVYPFPTEERLEESEDFPTVDSPIYVDPPVNEIELEVELKKIAKKNKEKKVQDTGSTAHLHDNSGDLPFN